MRVFLDANIFMYAAGRLHPHKDPSRLLLEAIACGEVEAVSDAEMLQELLYRFWNLKMVKQGVALLEQAVELVPAILPVEKSDLLVAKVLLLQHAALQPRDAIHAAVMFHHGITQLYSYDHHFDLLTDLTRLEPAKH